MANKTWAAATSGGWGTAGRWTPGTIPGTADSVFISVTGSAYNVTFNTSATISSLTISSANATLVSTTGTTARLLTVSNATTISGGTLNQSLASQSIHTASLSVTSGTLIESAGTFVATGLAAFSNTNNTFSGGSFTAGTITVGGSTSLTMSGSASVADTGGGIADSGTITGAGTLGESSGSITGSGVVKGSGGTLDTKSNIASTVGLQIDTAAGSTLELEGSVGSGGAATFNGTPSGASTLDLHNATALASFNGGGADVDNFNFIATSALPTVVEQIDAETVAFSSVHSATLTGGNSTITLFNNGGTALATFTLAGSLPGGTPFVDFKQDAGTGTDVYLSSVVCYTAGTRILTPEGERPVEDIAAGDTVITLVNGEHVPQPVKWVGERFIRIATHPRPELVAPVRICQNAFGESLPARDLLVSPDHCILVDGKLIPAKLLINGMTIVQDRDVRSAQYYHIELDSHAVLLAEGLAAESYLDTGNRAYFTNSGLALVLHPEFHVNAGLKCWEEDAVAPLAVSPEAVEPIWTMLASRAEALGHSKPEFITTEDADIHLVADGRSLRPVAVRGGKHVFAVPAGAKDIRIASRAAIPSDKTPWLDDWRRLGVAVKRIVVRSQDELMDIAADHPALSEGWYKAERDAASLWRWTDGNARLPVAADSALIVEVHVGITAQYAREPAERLAA